MIASIFTLLGGLGLFIYGMEAMSKAVQRIFGTRLKALLHALTGNRFTGVLSGVLVTAVMQSSSVTTVMIVSFVNAGLVALPQAIAMILGAHIGGTIIAQIIAFRMEGISLPLIALGAVLHIIGKSDRMKMMGEVFFGFGLLFLGFDFMRNAFAPLEQTGVLQKVLVLFSGNPALGLFVGMAVTIVVQSSSITTGITVALALSHAITFEQAVPLILGENIGTTITANLASISGSYVAKQAARAHFITNTIGALLALVLISPFMSFVKWLSPAQDIARQIANAHTIFNILTTLLFLPFIHVVARATNFLIQGTAEDDELAYLEQTSLTDAATALDLGKKALAEMLTRTMQIVKILGQSIEEARDEKLAECKKIHEKVLFYNRRLTEYLEKITRTNISAEQAKILGRELRILHEIERIMDYGEKMKETMIYVLSENRTFGVKDRRELMSYVRHVIQILTLTHEVLRNPLRKNSEHIVSEYDKLVAQKSTVRKTLPVRVIRHETGVAEANYFYDLVTALEEIARKGRNIAVILVE